LENDVDISVKVTKENKDGSADAVVRFDKLGLEVLVQWGLIAMLKEGINAYATSDQVKARARAAAAKNVNKRKPAAKKTPTIKGKVK
jgi:hypothetical protein